jgi:putative transposase
LQAQRWGVNREPVRCIRKHEGLQGIKTAPQRRPLGTSTTTPTRAAHPQQVWSDDFVPDETPDGRRLQGLTISEAYTREGLERSCARSIPAADVVQVLRRLLVQRGAPLYGKSDTGPACIAQRVTTWLCTPRVDTHLRDSGSPWQNGPNASLNGVFRDGGLHRWLFTSVQAARRIITRWREEYHDERPHGALEGLTPKAFAAQYSCQSQQAA